MYGSLVGPSVHMCRGRPGRKRVVQIAIIWFEFSLGDLVTHFDFRLIQHALRVVYIAPYVVLRYFVRRKSILILSYSVYSYSMGWSNANK